MPDASGFVRRMLKNKLKNRFGGVLLLVAQKRDATGVPGVEREVERALLLHPLHSQRPRRTCWNRCPWRRFIRRSCARLRDRAGGSAGDSQLLRGTSIAR